MAKPTAISSSRTNGRQTFLDLLGDMGRLWKIEIYAYCLMDNHYHLLLSTLAGVLSRPMRHLDGIYTQKFNRLHHRDGPLFRGRYEAIHLRRKSIFYQRRKSIFYQWSAIFIKILWGTCETVIGELSQFTDEGASSEREAASARVRRIEDTLTKSKRR